MLSRASWFGPIALLALFASIPGEVVADDGLDAADVVIRALEPNKLGVDGGDFKTKPNPKGAGVFVYHPRTRFHGVERFLIWLVLEDTAYPLNGPSKMVTPNLKWPRDADPQLWKQTGFSLYVATEAIDIVFGKR